MERSFVINYVGENIKTCLMHLMIPEANDSEIALQFRIVPMIIDMQLIILIYLKIIFKFCE